MLRVGLTGGIACGKSRVLRRMAAAGLHCIDLDVVAHGTLAPAGPAYADVLAAFGPTILAPDRSIDRRALAAIVFRDSAARERLNALVHPHVRAEEDRRTAAIEASPETVVVTDAALLVESGGHLRFDRLVVVHCPPELQLRRLMKRDGIDADAARARIDAQMPLDHKRRFAHFEVDTSGTPEDTDRMADSLTRELVRLAPTLGAPRGIPERRALGSLLHGPRQGPRGLRPLGLLDELARTRSPELERIARLLDPPASGPWYVAANPHQAGPAPATLAAPLALWALSRRAPDPPFLAAAAASLAWLTHVDPQSMADACGQVLLLQAALTAGVEGSFAAGEEWRMLAERFGGLPPSTALASVVDAVRRHGADVDGARRSAAAAGADPALAGMLSGSLAGASVADAGEDAARLVRALGI